MSRAIALVKFKKTNNIYWGCYDGTSDCMYNNLIPYNETENIQFKRTKKMQILAFYDILKKNGINVTIRKEFGSKVDAACGQLRSNQN